MLKVKWEKVLDYNNLDQRPLVSWIDLGNGTMYRITAFFIHGGRIYPRPGFFVGIERIGCFLFRLDNKIMCDYIMEKLNLLEPDARAIADWMNVQLDLDVPQQGKYSEKYINDVEPYGLIGENILLPLAPDIIHE